MWPSSFQLQDLHSTLIKYKERVLNLRKKRQPDLHSTLIKYKAYCYYTKFCHYLNLHSTLIKYKGLEKDERGYSDKIHLHSTLIKYKEKHQTDLC